MYRWREAGYMTCRNKLALRLEIFQLGGTEYIRERVPYALSVV